MILRSLLVVFSAIFMFSCSSKTKKRDMPKPEPTNTKVEKKGPDWTYSGAFGPKFWGDLDASYVLCKEGKHQSPIDLIWKKPAKPNPLTLMYSPVKAVVEDNGHGIAVNVKTGNSIKMRNSIYNLQRVDFRSPSEHLISGKSYPAELQFVHKNDNGFMAIMSVLVVEGKENALATKILSALPPAKNSSSELSEAIDLKAMIPKIHTLYNYAGSLTTPPCSEGVNWIVYNTPIEFSAAQIASLKNRYSVNNRPTQTLNDRAMVNY